MPETGLDNYNAAYTNRYTGQGLAGVQDAGGTDEQPKTVSGWAGDSTGKADQGKALPATSNAKRPVLPKPVDTNNIHSTGAAAVTVAKALAATSGQKKTATAPATQTTDDKLNAQLADIKADKKLTNDQVKQIKFALYHPEVVDVNTLDPVIKTNVENLKAQFPSTKLDVADYDDGVSADYKKNFDVELTKQAGAKGWSTQKQNALKALFLNPNAPVANKEDLELLLAELKKAAKKDTGEDTGVPKNVSAWDINLPTNTPKVGQNIIQMDYQHHNETAIADYINSSSPPLSEDAKGFLRKLFNDQNTPPPSSLSNELVNTLKQKAHDISAESVKKTRANYGLSTDWNPSGPALWTGSSASSQVLQYIDQMNAMLDNIAKNIPPGPLKATIMDFIGRVKQALSDLQESVYQMEIEKQISSSKQQVALKDTMELKTKEHEKQMDEQKAKQAEMADKQDKQSKTGNIMNIVNYCAMALMVLGTIAALFTGNIAMAVLLVILLTVAIHDAADSKNQWMSGAIEGLGNEIAKSGILSERDSQILAAAVVVIAIILLTICAGYFGGGASVASALEVGETAETAAEAATVASDLAETAEEAAEAADAAQEAADAAEQSAKVLEIASEADPSLIADAQEAADTAKEAADAAEDAQETANVYQESAEKAAKTSTELTQRAQKAAETSAKIIERAETVAKYSKMGSSFLKLASAGMGVYNADLKSQLNDLQADMGRLKAAAQASDTRMDDAIQEIQKMINKLLSLLSQLTSWNVSISKTAVHMWEKNKIDFTV